MKTLSLIVLAAAFLASFTSFAQERRVSAGYSESRGVDKDLHFLKNQSFAALRGQCVLRGEQLTSYNVSRNDGASLTCEYREYMDDSFCQITSTGTCTTNASSFQTYTASMNYSMDANDQSVACSYAEQAAAAEAGRMCGYIAHVTQAEAFPNSCACEYIGEDYGYHCKSEGWATCELDHPPQAAEAETPAPPAAPFTFSSVETGFGLKHTAAPASDWTGGGGQSLSTQSPAL